MSTTISAKGKCLCGAVQISAAAMSTNVGACHCNMCRRWTGGPFMAVECQGAVEFSGEESIKCFDSSDWAQRGFCLQCGTHLFYKLKQNNMYIVPAGLMNSESQLGFDHQVFIDEKPEYYAFSNQTKNKTGAELFAEFGAE